jgi:hypothetical protein
MAKEKRIFLILCVVDMPIELNIFNISLSPSMINLSRSDFAR